MKEVFNKITPSKMCKLSIIVPVYNCEKYINRCLEKLINIPIEKEIIVVYSQSTDKTLELLKEFSNDIIIVNQGKWSGVSVSRNIGLKNASGDYISFVDVDDDFDAKMHEKLIKLATKESADIAVCGFERVCPTGKITPSKHNYKLGTLNNKAGVENFLNDNISPYLWDKIFAKTITKKINFCENIKIGEDALFCLRAFLLSKKTTITDEVLYFYNQHPNSISFNVRNNLVFSFIDSLNNLTESETNTLKTEYGKLFNFYKNQMTVRALHTYIRNINTKPTLADYDLLKEICSKANIKGVLQDGLMPKKIKFEFRFIKIFGIKFYVFFTKKILKK